MPCRHVQTCTDCTIARQATPRPQPHLARHRDQCKLAQYLVVCSWSRPRWVTGINLLLSEFFLRGVGRGGVGGCGGGSVTTPTMPQNTGIYLQRSCLFAQPDATGCLTFLEPVQSFYVLCEHGQNMPKHWYLQRLCLFAQHSSAGCWTCLEQDALSRAFRTSRKCRTL